MIQMIRIRRGVPHHEEGEELRKAETDPETDPDKEEKNEWQIQIVSDTSPARG